MEPESLYIGGTKIEPYQRPPAQALVEAHVIEGWTFDDDDLKVPETSQDPAWLRPELQSLYDDSEELLRLLQQRVNENLNADWRDFKDEARIRRIAESVGTVADKLQIRLVGEVNKAFAKIDEVDKAMLSASDPRPPATVTEAVNQGFRGMELRNYLRSLKPQERTQVVENALETGQFWIFTEVMNGFPAVLDNDVVKELRQKFALAKFPWLAAMRKDKEIQANYTLARARKIAGIAGFSMIYRQLGLDYTPPPKAQETWLKYGRHDAEEWLKAQHDHGAALKKIVGRR
jgi:hypothetical protein